MDSPFSMNAVVSAGQADAPPTPEQNAGAAWGKAAGYVGTTNQRSEDAGRLNKTEYTMHSDGTVEVKTDVETVKMFQNALKMQQQIQGIYEQKIKENEAQQAGMKAHPFANALAQIGASVGAASKDPLVRGLGDAAQRLNPTMQQLKGEQQGLLKGAEGSAESQANIASRMLAHQNDTKMLEYQRKAAEAANKASADYLNKARLAVRAGGGTPMSYDAFSSGAVASGVPPERVPGLYKAHIEEASLAAAGKDADLARAEKKMTFGEQLGEKLATFKGKITGGNRIAAIDHAFRNSISPDAIAAKQKIHEATKAIDEVFATSKEVKVLGPAVQKDLSSASKTNQYLKSTQGMLELPEFAEVQGPLFSYNKDAPPGEQFKLNPQAAIPKQFQSADRAVVMSQISHEIPRLLGLLLNGQAGGASILRTDIGKKLVQDMGITGGIRVDQAKAILKVIRDTNNGNVAADMRAKAGANFSQIKDLLGATDPMNDYYFKERKDSFGNPLVPFPDIDQKGKGTGDQTPASAPPKGRYYDAAAKKWVNG